MIIKGVAARKELKKQLEDADDTPTLYRFSKLPPEIILIIIEFHFASLAIAHKMTLDLGMNSQPPISVACRMTRQLYLPLFYSILHFKFYLQDLPPKATLSATAQNAFERSPATALPRSNVYHVSSTYVGSTSGAIST